MVPGSLLSQIGRGYTDLCAALCAVGLGATELQVWKEVDGIFTADPRKVPKARLLSVVTPEEAAGEYKTSRPKVKHQYNRKRLIRLFATPPPFPFSFSRVDLLWIRSHSPLYDGTSHSSLDSDSDQECHEPNWIRNSDLPRCFKSILTHLEHQSNR